MDKVEAFVLIGGRSSRLGTDKAFVELDGRTLAGRAVENIRHGLSPERITMVAGSSTQFAIQAIATDVPFIFDLYEGRGPLGGIHAALAYARTSWIFVLACDFPFIRPEFIASMAGKLSDEFGAVAPRQGDGRLQPLCAFYNVEKSRPVIGKILESGRVSPPMHEIVMSLSPLIIGSDVSLNGSATRDPFTNINNTEDLELAKLSHSNGPRTDE